MKLSALKEFIEKNAENARQSAAMFTEGSNTHNEALENARLFDHVAKIIESVDLVTKSSPYEIGLSIAKSAIVVGYDNKTGIPDETNEIRDFWVIGNNLKVAVELFREIEQLNLKLLESNAPFLMPSLAKEIREFIELNEPEENT
jgi:hypothetical protein